jgi:ribosomal-protein-alanine N-acetyltransferase
MVVRGPELALRFARPEDAPALFELARDEEVTRFFSWGPYTDPGEPLAYIETLAPQREAGERLEFVIVSQEGDVPIGVTGLSEFARRDRRAMLGTWLGREHWGTGANTESKALVLCLAFRCLGLVRVSALTDPANSRSISALKRLGFVSEGVLKAWHRHGGVPKDCMILRLMRDEFYEGPLARIQARVEGEPPAKFVAGEQGSR